MSIHHFKFTLLSIAIGAVGGLSATADDSNQNKDRQPNKQGQTQADSYQANVNSEQSNDQDSEAKTKKLKAKNSQQTKSKKTDSKVTQSDNRDSQQSQDFHEGHVHVPLRWVTVAVDYDQDGRYDGWETIYYYDYQQASQRSQQRSQQSGQQSSSDGPQKTSIQGEIVQLTTEDSSNGSEKRVVAQVENSQGRKVEVCLGPQSKLSSLNLSKGDQVSAEGVVMRKDGQLKLIAAKVEANGQTVTHKLTKRPMLDRVKGELTSISEAESNRGDGIYLVGTVKTDSGNKTVHFGPKKQLSKLNLSEGDDINAITRTGSVSGKKAAIALQVSANDEIVKVVRQAKNGDGDQSGNGDQKSKQDRNNR